MKKDIEFDVSATYNFIDTIKEISKIKEIDISIVIEAIKYTELKKQSDSTIHSQYRISSDLQQSIRIGFNEMEKVLKQMTNTIYNTNNINNNDIPIKTAIDEIRQKRFLFLKSIYDKSNASSSTFVSKLDIMSMSNINDQDAQEIIQYLNNEGLIHNLSIDKQMMISHQGIKEIEDSLTKPTIATSHFPAQNIYNTINIENMENSQLQQSSNNSTQNATFNINDKELFDKFIKQIKTELPNLNLSSEDKSEINSDITTIETQISSSRPKINILKESIKSIQNILEGVASSVITDQLLLSIPIILSTLG